MAFNLVEIKCIVETDFLKRIRKKNLKNLQKLKMLVSQVALKLCRTRLFLTTTLGILLSMYVYIS